MSGLCLALMRFFLAAWAGIAVFFVAVVLRLRNSGLFTPEVMFNHPKVLFPLFYAFEFSLLGAALACGLAARRHPLARNRRFQLGLTCLAAALLVASADYLAVYGTLAMMIDQPPPLPPEFARYHYWSRWINAANLAICIAAAILVVWPQRTHGNAERG